MINLDSTSFTVGFLVGALAVYYAVRRAFDGWWDK